MNVDNKNQISKKFNSHKKKVLNVLLIFTTISLVIFALVNYQRGKYLLVGIELVAGVISFMMWYFLKSITNIIHFQRIAFAYVVMFCGFLLFAFWQLDISITAYTFVLLMPFMAHLLLGNNVGLVITAIFICLTGVIFFQSYHTHPIFNDLTGFYNLIVVTILIWGLAYSYEQANEEAKETLIRMASRDYLTDLYNRTMLNDVFHYKLNKSVRNQQPLSILVADLDHFKKINDLYGHKAGDQFIKKFAEILKQHSGTNSACFRVGGEEFCVILSNTDIERGREIAENIRQATEFLSLNLDKFTIPVTVSIGIVACHKMTSDISNLLELADQKLYQAKQQGRNQVVS